MQIRFKETTRGGGKIFVRVICSEMPSDSCLRAKCATKEGGAIPATLMIVPEVEGWVLVLPVLLVAQRVTVWVEDGRGVVAHTCSKTIVPSAAKLHSQVNTALRNAVAERIRNADVRYAPTFGLFIGMDELICAHESGHDVIRGSVRLRTVRADVVPAVPELRFLDGQGHDASLDSWIPMGGWRAGENNAEWVWPFSVHVSQDLASLVMWVHDPSTGCESFACYEDFVLRDARLRWDGFVLPAWRDPAYHEWFVSHQRADKHMLELQRARGVDGGPLFSIVVPLYRTPQEYLRDMIESFLAQTYDTFELILVNASPEDEQLTATIDAYACRDERIKTLPLKENLGIAHNTLAGVDTAQGDFVCFMDHDDVVEPDVLYRYAQAVVTHPTTDLLYCDEDKLRDGRYVEPFLKSDWNPDLLCSQNYVCHLLAVRRSIVQEMPVEEYVRCEGSQDHFLALFAGERARNVWHERHVLHHWRVHPASTAAGSDSKPYTIAAGVRAVQAHLDRMGIKATARERADIANTYQVDYELRESPLVSIIIPNKDMAPVLRRCVASLLEKSTYKNIEVIIIENNSIEQATFELYDELECHDSVRVVRQSDANGFNFAKTINFGAEQAQGTYLVLLNNDTEVVAPDWVERMLGHCQRPEVGCVGAKLVYPDGLIQHAGVVMHMGMLKHMGRKLDSNVRNEIDGYQLTRDVSAVTGACLMIRKDLFDELGGLDESLPNDYNDVNLCLQLRAHGLLVVFEPGAELIHYESISRGEHESKELRRQFAYSTGVLMSRWPEYFALGDPYWNPGLWRDEPYRHLQW